MKHLLLHITFLCAVVNAKGQRASIELKANVTPTSIQLRWGVSSASLWYQANELGYTLERYTVVENDVVLPNPRKKVLSTTLKPALLPDWEEYINDDYMAIMAQALYGDSFDLDAGNTSQIAQIVNKVREQENRYSFAMFAADQSVQAARLAGLFLEDFEVSPDEKYLYKIYLNEETSNMEYDTGKVFISLKDLVDLPSPIDVSVEFGDQTAVVSWNSSIYQEYYNSFWIERSLDDGKTFQRITKKPFVTLGNDDRAYKSDSLAANYTNVAYRVLGVSPFGELSIPSDTISGKGLPSYIYRPVITGYQESENRLDIHWDFPSEGIEFTKEFQVFKKSEATGISAPVAENIQPTQTSVRDTVLWSSAYYIVRAVDMHDRTTMSFPFLIQLEDSIPPLAPVDLKGSIDTSGQVRLSWSHNTEPDIFGYKLFRSNDSLNNYIQLEGGIIKGVRFVDQIDVKNLSDKIYYKIIALDKRYNPSPESSVLHLTKPDLLPPISPLLKNIRADSLGIFLSWTKSASEDVLTHLLYRRAMDEQSWRLILKVSSIQNQDFYLDKDVRDKVKYAYTMLAVDDASLESSPAEPLTITWVDKQPAKPVTDIGFRIIDQQLELNWNYDEPVSGYQIYKRAGENYTLFSVVNGVTTRITDSYRPDQQCYYKILAILSDGKYSLMSKEVVVR